MLLISQAGACRKLARAARNFLLEQEGGLRAEGLGLSVLIDKHYYSTSSLQVRCHPIISTSFCTLGISSHQPTQPKW